MTTGSGQRRRREPSSPAGPESRLDRSRKRTAAVQARAKLVADRAELERSRHASVDALFDTVDRDVEVGGGIIAGALAYQLFIWMLPFALVCVAGLGVGAGAASTSPEGAAKSVGLAGLVSGSVESAAKDSARWYALLIGVPILFLATRSVLRTLIGAHRLVWTDLRAAAPRPTLGATTRLLALVLCFFLVTGAASAGRAWSPGPGVVVSLIAIAPYTGIWLLISLRLPHRDSGWRSLAPGALLFGAGVELLQLVAAYFIAPMSLNKQGTYGALGMAAGVLLGLYLFSRLVIAAADLNATLWERHERAAARVSDIGRP